MRDYRHREGYSRANSSRIARSVKGAADFLIQYDIKPFLNPNTTRMIVELRLDEAVHDLEIKMSIQPRI
jgi:hypothetical protein